MRENKGRSPIQYATIILVIVALVGSWMAYSKAGTAKGATKKEVESATKGLATKSDLEDLAKGSTLKSVSKDILSAIRGKKKITRADVVGFLSGKSWSDTKTLLDRAGVSVPKKKVKETDVVDFLSGKDWSSAKSILDRAGVDIPEGGGAEQKLFSDQKIGVMIPTSTGDPFWAKEALGAKYAGRLTGADVTVSYGGQEDPSGYTQVCETFLQKEGADGIALVNAYGKDVTLPLVEEAKDKGIKTVSYNISIDEAGGYIGQSEVAAGRMLGKYIVNELGFSNGDTALWVSMGPSFQYALRRENGIKQGFEAAGVTDYQFKIVDCGGFSMEKMLERAPAWLRANPEPAVIMFDGGQILQGTKQLFQTLGWEKGKVPVVGFDINTSDAKQIRDGWINAAVDQQPFLQSFLSVINLCLQSKYGFSSWSVNTGGFLITQSNVGPVMEYLGKVR